MNTNANLDANATAAIEHMVGVYLDLHPIEAALDLNAADALSAAELLATQTAVTLRRVLQRIRPEQLAKILKSADADFATTCLAETDPAKIAAAFAWLDDNERQRLLELCSGGVRKEVEIILAFPPGTCGEMMDARVALFSATDRAEDVLKRVRTLADRRVSDLVLADAEGKYEGVVRLQDLATADLDARLGSIKSPVEVTIDPLARRDDVVGLLNEHRLASLPVVDAQKLVVGVVRHATLVEAAQRAAAGDLQQMVGGSAEETALSSPWVGVKSRLPWLNINLVTAFAAAAVVGLFEDTISRFTALAVLLPVVAGQSGNTGAQALAVTMRGLALREIRLSHAFKVLRKELAIGLINGIAIALVTSLGVFLWSRSFGLALVMFLAMIMSMVAASASGGLIPMLLVRLGRDPAVASSILLTTVTDIAGFFSFLGLATVLSSLLESLATKV